MKLRYKGKEGIASLKLKRADEKKKAKPRKSWQEKRGIISRLCEEMLYSGNRRIRRLEAKDVIKDPLAFDHLFKK